MFGDGARRAFKEATGISVEAAVAMSPEEMCEAFGKERPSGGLEAYSSGLMAYGPEGSARAVSAATADKMLDRAIYGG